MNDGIYRIETLAQRSDLKISRHAIETLAQRFRHRNSVRAAVETFGMALLTGKPDALDARQPARLANVADETIHGLFELRGRHERLDRQRHDRLAGIGCLAGFFDEIDDLAPSAARFNAPARSAMMRLKP